MLSLQCLTKMVISCVLHPPLPPLSIWTSVSVVPEKEGMSQIFHSRIWKVGYDSLPVHCDTRTNEWVSIAPGGEEVVHEPALAVAWLSCEVLCLWEECYSLLPWMGHRTFNGGSYFPPLLWVCYCPSWACRQALGDNVNILMGIWTLDAVSFPWASDWH